MRSRPRLRTARAATAERAAEELARLRRFHLVGPSVRGDDSYASPSLLPLHLFPHRRPERVRSLDLLLLRPEAGDAGCELLADALDGAIDRDADVDSRILADGLGRVEQLVRERVETDEDAKRILDEVGEALVAELARDGAAGGSLRATWEGVLERLALDGAELVRVDEHASPRLLLRAVRGAAIPRRAAFRSELEDFRDGLHRLLSAEHGKDPGASNADALRDAVGALGSKLVDPAALARVIGAPRGSKPIDAQRRARVEAALATIERVLADEPAPLMTVVHDPGVPPHVNGPDVALVPDTDPCATAAARFDGAAARCADVFRAVRTARLELAGAYEPERHAPWLDELDWEGFSRQELLLVPVCVALESAEHLSGPRMLSLSRLLRSGRPVQVLATARPAANPAAPTERTFSDFRLELAYLGVGHREAFVQQSSPSWPLHLFEGLRGALDRTRTALHVIAAGGGGDTVDPWLQGSAAVEGRAHPLFRYDPEAGETWARRFDVSDNPEPDEPWTSGVVPCRDPAGAEVELAVPFTFVDYALLEPSLAPEFELVDEDCALDDLVSIADFLALGADEAAHALPFVWAVDGDERVRRLVATRRLVQACRDRADFWRTLQELAGLRNEHVREAVERAREEAAAEARAEIDALRADHVAALTRAKDEAVGAAMSGLARSLLGMEPGLVIPAIPPPEGVPPAGGRAATPEEPPASKEERESAPAATAPSATEEPWIETPLCTSCNDCCIINPKVFVYDENKQARIGDARAGTYAQLVRAAEQCPARCIHPGTPLDPSEPKLEALLERARPFNV